MCFCLSFIGPGVDVAEFALAVIVNVGVIVALIFYIFY
jgi:hypothetical protein